MTPRCLAKARVLGIGVSVVAAVLLLVLGQLCGLGTSTALLCLPIVLLVSGMGSATAVWGACVFCAVVTLAGLVRASGDGDLIQVLVEGALALLGIWVVAYLAVRNQAIRMQVQEQGNELRRTIAEFEGQRELLRERQKEQARRSRAMVSVLEDLEQERGKLKDQITRRYDAEQGRARLAAIIEASDDAIIGKSLDGTITSWNRGAERLYGYTEDEIVGRSVDLLTPGQSSGELAQMLARIRRGDLGD